MSDVMKIATDRREDLINLIAEMEDEIVRMQDEIARLDGFLEMGSGLISAGSLGGQAAEDSVAQAEDDDEFDVSASSDADDVDDDEYSDIYDDQPMEAASAFLARPTSKVRDESDLATQRVIRQIMPVDAISSDDDFDGDMARGY